MIKTVVYFSISLMILATTLSTQEITVAIDPYNPPIHVPAGGGSFSYSITVTNGEDVPQSFDLWTEASLPNAKLYGPVFGPVEFSLPEGWSANRDDLSQYVPGAAPPGIYTYTAHVGTYPNQILDSDSVELEKLSGIEGWYSQSPGADVGIYGVSFVDANNGWAAGTLIAGGHESGAMLHTETGGE